MNKCLVTKYDGMISGSGYSKVGEIAIKQTALAQTTAVDQALYIVNTKECSVRIEGNAYFTDETLSQNLGKSKTIYAHTTTILYISNNDCTIYINNKYTLTILIFGKNTRNLSTKENKTFDIAELKYIPNLETIALQGTTGDIASISGSTAYVYFQLSNKAYGDISAIKNNLNMTYLFVPSRVTGDCSAFKNMTKLIAIYNTGGKVGGDIANLAGCTALTGGILSSYYTGDISSLRNLSNLTKLNTFFSALTGDLAVMPDNFFRVEFCNSCNFTWSTRKSTAKIISIQGAPKIDNIDKMLQDQANCVVSSESNKMITATGTRTSASDVAVATLQSKGYTVSITPA